MSLAELVARARTRKSGIEILKNQQKLRWQCKLFSARVLLVTHY